MRHSFFEVRNEELLSMATFSRTIDDFGDEMEEREREKGAGRRRRKMVERERKS